MHSMVQLGFASTRVIQRKLFSSIRNKVVTRMPLMQSLQGVLKHLIKPRILRWCHPHSALLQANHVQSCCAASLQFLPNTSSLVFYLVSELILTAEKLWIPLLITNSHAAHKRPLSNGRHIGRKKVHNYALFALLWSLGFGSLLLWQLTAEEGRMRVLNWLTRPGPCVVEIWAEWAWRRLEACF